MILFLSQVYFSAFKTEWSFLEGFTVPIKINDLVTMDWFCSQQNIKTCISKLILTE
jgi:MarR-like DNA-binding transcriptional regulator SgrR of sgrS sRNA